ncbi:MAG: DNA repair exonuclease [Gemmatimonadetes bacterium]|nr:DNA repair exonuclease [Gemmatimonadota bacterium]
MRIAHLADVHLGFRQYHRQTPQGINQREADVAQAFRRALDDVIAARPDLVVVAGDLFHSVRPVNAAILDSFNQFRRLREGLPEAPIVLIGGNHDTPRSVETGTILKLFEALPGVVAVPQEPRYLRFEQLDLSVFCVPYAAAVSARPRLVPSGDAGRNVLVVHGRLAGLLPGDEWWYDHAGPPIEPGELNPERWDYVALGHYHVAHRVRENAWYAGALEYVSPNPWGELRDEERDGRCGQKGWLLVELGARLRVEFRPVALARRVIDLEPIEGAGVPAERLDALVCERVTAIPGGIDEQVVRQLVWNVPRYVARDLDHARVREFKARALHYHLDIRRPPPRREVGVGGPGSRRSLADIVEDVLSRRPLEAQLDRQRLLALARSYLERVEREAPEP